MWWGTEAAEVWATALEGRLLEVYSPNHSFIQQIVIECLLWARQWWLVEILEVTEISNIPAPQSWYSNQVSIWATDIFKNMWNWWVLFPKNQSAELLHTYTHTNTYARTHTNMGCLWLLLVEGDPHLQFSVPFSRINESKSSSPSGEGSLFFHPQSVCCSWLLLATLSGYPGWDVSLISCSGFVRWWSKNPGGGGSPRLLVRLPSAVT
jgi:hypothetical protein